MHIRLIPNIEKLKSIKNKYTFDDYPEDLLSCQFEVGLAFSSFRSLFDFHVSGFGEERWPLSLETDFVILLEQLLPFCEWIFGSTEDNFIIDFYEQGVERVIHYSRRAEIIKITCESYTDWVPNPKTEFISKNDLIAEITAFITALFLILQKISPILVENVLIKEWKERLKIKF